MNSYLASSPQKKLSNLGLIVALVVVSLLVNMLLAACGEGTSTPIPAATTAIPATTIATTAIPATTVATTVAATTVAPTTILATTVAATTVAPTTIVPTTAPVTTAIRATAPAITIARATTAAAEVKEVLLVDYVGAKPVEIGVDSVQTMISPSGNSKFIEPKVKAMVLVDNPVKVYDFYKANFKEQGFSIGSDSKSTIQGFSYLFYYTGNKNNEVAAIVMGPFDAFNLSDTLKDAPELAGKIKLGDTLIILASGIRK